ncbi:hypothetical protein [Spirosoma telluris]|uniref:hypothetical protein n=1 Tax=Spirosoma telluris TaxID=2183553 RepID=UPI002FC31791
MENSLDSKQIQDFIQHGFVRIDQAFSSKLAEEGRNILWADSGCDPTNPATWTKPVIRLGNYAQEPFRQAANTPRLLAAFDQLVGPGRWLPALVWELSLFAFLVQMIRVMLAGILT